MVRPISAESHSDPLMIPMASSNFSPIQVGFGMFAVLFRILFHRLLSSTFVGRFRSLNSFCTSSTEWMKVSTRLATFGLVEDMMIDVGAIVVLVHVVNNV